MGVLLLVLLRLEKQEFEQRGMVLDEGSGIPECLLA
jgi:hypothetical protein